MYFGQAHNCGVAKPVMHNKTNSHYITEISLKVAFTTHNTHHIHQMNGGRDVPTCIDTVMNQDDSLGLSYYFFCNCTHHVFISYHIDNESSIVL